MKLKLFGTDGIREIANKYPLTPEMVTRIGTAAAYYLRAKYDNKKHWLCILGKDPRISSDMLANAFVAGITSVGVDVLDLGIMPTPSISYFVEKYKADLGVVISASHNPFEYNGIKFFNKFGEKFSQKEEAILESILFSFYELEKELGLFIGKVYREDKTEEYLDFLSKALSQDLSGLKVALDCANGSTFKVAPLAFKKLKAFVYSYNTNPDGININDKCGSLYPEFISEKVLKIRADLGFAFDGDGDRVVVVDENGKIYSGDKIIALLAKQLNVDKVVLTIMSNFGLEKYFEEKNIKVFRSKVGDREVYYKMKKENAILGGEDSGHIILRNYLKTGDGLLTALIISKIVVETGKSLSELIPNYKEYFQAKDNIKVKNKKDFENYEPYKNFIEKYKNQARFVVRYSGTEPVLRIMVEAEDENLAKDLLERLKNILKNFLEGGQ